MSSAPQTKASKAAPPSPATSSDSSSWESVRDSFLAVLHNEQKYEQGIDLPVREHGFVMFVRGRAELTDLQDACENEQQYNRCITSLYAAKGPFIPEDLIVAFLRDTVEVTTGSSPIGGFRGVEGVSWAEDFLKKTAILVRKIKSTTAGNRRGLDRALREVESNLEKGERLVLLCEVEKLDAKATPPLATLEAAIALQSVLPERMGLVISGLTDDREIWEKFENSELPLLPPWKRSRQDSGTRSQPLANDSPSGPDRLNVSGEAYALADALALCDMEPPLVVGVMGGWGSGKSFILHLVEQRLLEIRSRPLDFDRSKRDEDRMRFPYVGHPYVIGFDAWTFAKSNLWASLMQRIFGELSRQISLERFLHTEAEIDSRTDRTVWAALYGKSPRKIEEILPTFLSDEAKEKLEKAPPTGEQLWIELNQLRRDQIQHLQEREEKLAELDRKLATEHATVERAVDSEIEREIRDSSWMPVLEVAKLRFTGALGDLIEEAWGNAQAKSETPVDGDGTRPTGAESVADEAPLPSLDTLQSSVDSWKKVSAGMTDAAGFVLVLLAIGFIVPWFTGLDVTVKMVSTLATGIAAAAPILTAFQRSTSALTGTYSEYAELAERHRTRLKAKRDGRLHEELLIQRKPGGSLDDLESERSAVAADVDRLREVVGVTASHASLVDFLRSRLESRSYEKELGLMHQVQRDLEQLSEGMLAAGPYHPDGEAKQDEDFLFPRGEPRVILMVDDLDRCPPARVVEVLEAAQLLVKTRLFVVILAMDVRYVTRCLEKEYKEVLDREGVPTGLDYIEKIVQIPYRVRSMHREAIPGFLRSQTLVLREKGKRTDGGQPGESFEVHPLLAPENRLRAALPIEVQAFEDGELALLEESLAAIPVTPRSAKRLINVFKLLKNIWYRRGEAEEPDENVKKALTLIITAAALHPRAMGPLLAELIDRCLAKKQTRALKTYFPALIKEVRRKHPRVAGWDELSSLLGQNLPARAKVGELNPHDLRLVQSFSFCGEVDPERPDGGSGLASEGGGIPEMGSRDSDGGSKVEPG